MIVSNTIEIDLNKERAKRYRIIDLLCIVSRTKIGYSLDTKNDCLYMLHMNCTSHEKDAL